MHSARLQHVAPVARVPADSEGPLAAGAAAHAQLAAPQRAAGRGAVDVEAGAAGVAGRRRLRAVVGRGGV